MDEGKATPLSNKSNLVSYAVVFGLVGASAVFAVNDLLVNSHPRHDKEGERHHRQTKDPPEKLPVAVGIRRGRRRL